MEKEKSPFAIAVEKGYKFPSGGYTDRKLKIYFNSYKNPAGKIMHIGFDYIKSKYIIKYGEKNIKGA